MLCYTTAAILSLHGLLRKGKELQDQRAFISVWDVLSEAARTLTRGFTALVHLELCKDEMCNLLMVFLITPEDIGL